MFGIQQSAAPNSVSNILNLRSLDGRSFAGLLSQAAKIDPAPSMASGLRKEEDVKDNYIYAHPDENNSKQYLKICIHNRHRKLQEADIEHFENKIKWWDVRVAATLRFEPEIAQTVPDYPEEKPEGEKSSPVKKKQRRLQELDTSKRLGPGGHRLENLGGCGDCLQMQSLWTPLGQKSLLARSLAVDETATEITETGAIPGNLEQFKVALKREYRWACGVTLQSIANIKKVNLIVLEDKANRWVRTRLITCEEGASTKMRKLLVLVLHESHYYLVLTYLSIDESWLGTGDVIWCSKTKRRFFTRGGVGSLRTPSKNSFAALQDLCRPCSTVQSPGESSDRALKAHDIQANVLRTCSTKISHWLRPGSDGKSNGSKIKSVQKDNGLLKNVRSWTCKICGFQLEGQRYRDSRGKIDYHLHSIHAAKY